jgi:secreted PhoX family phosphatase
MPFVLARRAQALGFGALEADPNGTFDLPPGFSYSVVEVAGSTMSDGYLVPYRPDGMAAFPGPNGSVVLMRNHELDLEIGLGAYGTLPVPAEAYDPRYAGGVTRVVLDGTTFARVSSNLVLTGTSRNCSGGPSPWGWLSCEESTQEGHGYVFLCPTDAETVRAPERIVGYGRLYHEAVAIEPGTNAAYLTEDRGDGCLYRFLPDDPSRPFVGRLQALAVTGQPRLRTQSGLVRGQVLDVHWVDVGDPDSASDTLRYRATDAGAATFYRGEGATESGGTIYIAATFGGSTGYGQIFALRPTRDGGTLTVLAESPDPEVLNGPDNLTVAPWGDVLVAEDGLHSYRYVRGITPNGSVYDIGRSLRGELAGVCFSPDGRALFVNIQDIGLTLAVTGPFDDYDPSGGFGGQGGEGGDGDGTSAGAGGVSGTSATAGTPGSSGSSAGGHANGGAGGPGTAGPEGASRAGDGGRGAGSSGSGGRGGGSGGRGGKSAGQAGETSGTGAGSGGSGARVTRPGLRRDHRVGTQAESGCACHVVGRKRSRG